MASEDAVRVCVRVRPLSDRENAEAGDIKSIPWKSDKYSISQADGAKTFPFDRVFQAEENTSAVYKEVADPIIKSAVQGYHGTIFAYGQTASGKTHTMLGTESSPGILPMAIEDVFKTIRSIPDREFLLRISYMEIYNETIKDLLCTDITKKKPLMVREDISRTIYVEDLIEEVVVSPEEAMRWLLKGEKNRHYGETKMSARSSRSHTIFRMIIESKEEADSSSSDCDGAVMVSHLNLVDLAGSERPSQAGTEGIRFKEGCSINQSLFTLGQVIKKLGDGQSGGFINYRDSKLTRILQNSLGGNAKTVIICTVTPVSLEETLSTLQFASTAKKIKNRPQVNEVLDDDALLKRYRREIEELKRRLEEVSSDCHTRGEEKDQLAQLLEEKNSLQKQQEDRIRTLAKLVVPSSSFLQEQELKPRQKRRVTWTPGQISHHRDVFSEDFSEKLKRFKVSLSTLSEMEESAISDIFKNDDPCPAISAAVPEEEWIPGPDISLIHKNFEDSVLLCETLAAERDSAVTKQEATLAELETLQLEKEQLWQEVKELTEKIETNEFVVLEKEIAEEHEDEQEAESLQQLGMQNSLLQKERDDLQQAMEEVKAENDRLRGRLRENTEKGLELQEQLSNADGSLKEYHDMVEKLRCQNCLASKTEEELNQTIEQLKQKAVDTQAEVEKLLEKTRSQEQQVIRQESLIVLQEKQLRKREAELGEEMTQLKEKFSKTNAELQKDLHELREQLAKATEEKTLENKEREDHEILQAKVSKIEEALQKFPVIEQRYEYLGKVAWNLMTEINSEKELVTEVLKDVSHEKEKQIRRLQMEHKIASNGLQRLLNKTQFLSIRLCKRETEYYGNISSYTMELLGERRKQHELLTQIQSLKEPCRSSHAAISQQLCIPELSQSLDFHVEQIWKDVSQMEEEIYSIEVMLQQLENDGRKMERHSVPFDIQDFETVVKQDNERLFPAGQFLKPKPQPLIEAKKELESRNINYCKETEAALKACRERTRELRLALNMAKEQQTPRRHADLNLEEENCRLESKLKAQDQDIKDLKLKIQGQEKAANEAKQNLLEKERRIAVLEMELKVRTSRSEVVRLRAALEEKETVLTNTLTENQTLKARLNKGAELYKEEIEDLKTQLAKADMTQIKESKRFGWELANAKALVEQRDEQLRKVREELCRAHLEQDITVMQSQNVPQPPLPITCGGGSEIVQNTQVLVLNAERAKLVGEVGRLKKENELLLTNELHLKEEVKKWKERALKMREQPRARSEERRLTSPRKTAPPLLTGPSSSPSKEGSVQPPPAMDKPPCLGTFSDVSLADGNSKETALPENTLKRWLEKANKEGNPDFKTQ